MGQLRSPDRFIRYGIAGILSNGFGYSLFLIISYFLNHPVVASTATYVIVLSTNYAISRKWVFRSIEKHRSDVPRYLLAYTAGLIVTVVSMGVLSRLMRPELAQIIVILLSALVIYGSLVLLRFGSRGKDSVD